MELIQLLEHLCTLSGVSGDEKEVSDFIEQYASSYADEVHRDTMGNVIVFKKGRRVPEKRVMLAAHMDEVGVIVTAITEDGYLKFDAVGGIDRRVIIGKQVFIGPHRVAGVISLKAYHLTEKDEENTIPKLQSLYIDIGARSREDAEKQVKLGDTGSFAPETVRFGNGFLKAKAIDDRIGCAVMLKLMEEELPIDCYFSFTVQEEVGCRGALALAFQVKPEIALILEGTTAVDIPTNKGSAKVCVAGGGPVIPFMDRATIYNRVLYGMLTKLADENGIPWQTKTQIAGGTDASVIQRSGRGTAVAALSAAVRYIHSPSSTASIKDLENILKLAKLFVAAI